MKSDQDERAQILDVLKRFNDFVSTKNLRVLDEFAKGDEVLLVGSDLGEIATGS